MRYGNYVVFFVSEQDRQCLHIATLRRVRVTITAVEKQYYIS